MKISEKIFNLRSNSKISQEKLALDLGISRQAVSKWETGQSIPDLDNIKVLAEYFNVDLDYLIDDDFEIETKKNDIGKKINVIKLISKSAFLTVIGLSFQYIITMFLLILFQVPIASILFHSKNHIFHIPIPSLISIIIVGSFFIVMTTISLRKLNKTNKNCLFELFAVISIVCLLDINNLVDELNRLVIVKLNGVDQTISYSNLIGLLNYFDNSLFVIGIIYVFASSLLLVSKFINKDKYTPITCNKQYKKWHGVIVFFSTLYLGIISIPFYISFRIENLNNPTYNINKIKTSFKSALITNIVITCIFLLVLSIYYIFEV